MLIELIWQHNDKPFQAIFTKARKGFLNNNDITIVNNKVISILPIYKPEKNIVIVQQNIIWYTINWLQIQRFAKANNCDVILFPAQHSWMKRDSGEIVDDTDLLTVQDSKKTCIGPGLLYYYQKMSAYLLIILNI